MAAQVAERIVAMRRTFDSPQQMVDDLDWMIEVGKSLNPPIITIGDLYRIIAEDFERQESYKQRA